MDEKLGMIKDIIADGVSEYTGNLLCVLTERGRMGCFSGIVKNFRALYNEHFRIAEITVTASAPLSESVREKIAAKMSEVTGKTVSIKERSTRPSSAASLSTTAAHATTAASHKAERAQEGARRRYCMTSPLNSRK